MEKNKINKFLLLNLLIFASYNLVLFVVCGFTDHYASFWISYAFTLVSFGLSAFCIFSLKGRSMIPRDWLFHYPFYKDCFIYVTVEIIVSIIFIILDDYDFPWQASFLTQFILMAAFLSIILSCFAAKDIIQKVEKNVKTKTQFIKLLLVDVETILERASDPSVKAALTDLREKVRYSDPVSSEQLADVEDRLASEIDVLSASVSCNDNQAALQSCKNALLILSERNRKCKAFK